jgi:hypothetical protein
MRRFLFLSAAGGAAAWLLRRRSQRQDEPAIVPTMPAPVETSPEPPAHAYERGPAEGQEERERESEATDETRYERLREAEQAAREETADRLASDPPPEPEAEKG